MAQELGADQVASMRQVHGRDVVVVRSVGDSSPECDGLVTRTSGLALCVRVADCVPVILADVDHGVVGVVHAGRAGIAANVVSATVEAMRREGSRRLDAWIGPHVCGGCYEVPAHMRAMVSASAPVAFGCTTWGTPALDLGAAVCRQLLDLECVVEDVSRCTLETPDLYSHRRDGAESGRLGGFVVFTATDPSTATACGNDPLTRTPDIAAERIG
ncbi:MAG: polyphenol oxidase family protein [Nocardioidaceae bacterium]